MIRLILSGGLGNQMFQYAAGKALSILQSTDLLLDTHILNKKTKATERDYQLDIFNITDATGGLYTDRFILKTFLLFNQFPCRKIFRDNSAQSYDNRFSKLPKDIILFGYFQNQRYFLPILEQLRQCFTFKYALDDHNQVLQKSIDATNSVSIHIRRGDYLKPNSSQSLLSVKYYQRAIEYLRLNLKDPNYYVFSDDMDWVKHNLKLPNNHTLVDWNKSEDSYKDMQLMSLCKHNVIANSSFSWWGAWLNSYAHKIVIAPSNWYKSDIGMYPEGFIPDDWIIL